MDADDAVKHGLVTALKYENEVQDEMKDKLGLYKKSADLK